MRTLHARVRNAPAGRRGVALLLALLLLVVLIAITIQISVTTGTDARIARNDLTMEDVKFWAVHPGGRRIVDAVRDRLDLSEEDVAGSYEVLARYGNMSSPTILFVLEAALDRVRDAGELGVALAFGPGLTLESMLLESV